MHWDRNGCNCTAALSRVRVVVGWLDGARSSKLTRESSSFFVDWTGTGLDWTTPGGIHAPSFLLACSRKGRNIWAGTRSGQILISRPAWGARAGFGRRACLLLFLNIVGKMAAFLFLAHLARRPTLHLPSSRCGSLRVLALWRAGVQNGRPLVLLDKRPTGARKVSLGCGSQQSDPTLRAGHQEQGCDMGSGCGICFSTSTWRRGKRGGDGTEVAAGEGSCRATKRARLTPQGRPQWPVIGTGTMTLQRHAGHMVRVQNRQASTLDARCSQSSQLWLSGSLFSCWPLEPLSNPLM